MNIVTCIAPVNIAVIKYWGKKSEELIIPLNDSLSATLSLDQMCAKTTIMAHADFKENRIWLNGKEESFENVRLNNCLQEVRKRAKTENESISSEMLSWNVHICSENNFPTAAGLASSAAGYACLVYAMAELYSITSDISGIARRGSGSACRSVFGGWVRWYGGSLKNGLDSVARQIATPQHWPQMRIIILVVNDRKKNTSSSIGMKNSVATSDLLKYRVEHCVPQRMERITKAIQERDFDTFARITMQDSNQFHAVCLDTFPPCVYMNDISHAIVRLVHEFNDVSGGIQVAYTFDAGPNACLYLLEEHVPTVLSLLKYYFPANGDDVEYIQGISVDTKPITQNLINDINFDVRKSGEIKYIIHTKVGEGPRVLNNSNDHLLTEKGLPKRI